MKPKLIQWKRYFIIVICCLLLFSNFTTLSFSEETDGAQHIPSLNINFDLTTTSNKDNEYVLDIMKYISGQIDHDIPAVPIEISGIDDVYGSSVTEDVYMEIVVEDDSQEETSEHANLGSIINLPELQTLSWEELIGAYREAAVYQYLLPNRTLNFSMNKLDFEVYNRLIYLHESESLTVQLVSHIHTAIHHILSSEYKIVQTTIEDAKNLESFNSTKRGAQRLGQAEVHWNLVQAQLEKGNTRPAMNALQHANFKAQEVLEVHGLKYSMDMVSNDTDGDGLSDLEENMYLTDVGNPDTDGDGLNDYYEVAITLTDPLVPDTNDNGISDGQEDFDGDQLTNIEEFHAGTNPYESDTDFDRISDSQELRVYYTDPLKYDTDGDSIGDGRELELGLNPLANDSDGNGILDQNEMFTQPIPITDEFKLQFEEAGIIPEVTVYGPALETHAVNVRPAQNTWKQVEETRGILGHAIDIETDKPFEKATLTFHYNDTALKGSNPNQIRVLWYDEVNRIFVNMPNQRLDVTAKTISIDTNHFSYYMVVDWSKWEEAFKSLFNPGRPSTLRGKIEEIVLATVYADRGEAILNSGIADFSKLNSIRNSSNLSGNITPSQQFKQVNHSSLLESAISVLSVRDSGKWKTLIFPVDSETPMPVNLSVLVQKAKDHHIKIFPVNTGEVNNTGLLQELAEKTYGQYFSVPFDTASDAVSVISGIYDRIKEEEDADGIPDRVETSGMRITDGSFVKTSISLEDNNNDGIPDGRDSDMDGLTDGYEMGYTDRDGNAFKEATMGYINLEARSAQTVRIASASNSSYSYYQYLDYISNPNSNDSDRDGYIDDIDADPRESYIQPIFLLHGVWSNVKNVFGAYNYFADEEGRIFNNNEDSTDEMYYNHEKQKIKDTIDGSFAEKLGDTYGVENVFAFNYAHDGDFYKSSWAFHKYLNVLFEDEKLIKSPTINGVPEITVIAHSMGGLVARSYIELSQDPESTLFKNDQPKVKIDKLITLATPHWGGSGKAYAAGGARPFGDALPMLNPNHCIYEGCSKSEAPLADLDDDYGNNVSFKDNINREDNKTSYYAIIGGAIKDAKKVDGYIGRAPKYKYYDIPLFSWAPENGSNYEPQAEDYASNYINEHYSESSIQLNFNGVGAGNDGYVTINSGLGYKWKLSPFLDDLEMNMEYKFIFFGPAKEGVTNSVHHKSMHHNQKILDIVEVMYEL